MKVSIIQTSLHWENREKNLVHFNSLIGSIKEQSDLIVLPEMFTTGFSMKPEKIAEQSNSETLAWLKNKAKERKAVITGSVAVEENGKFFNRLFWVEPNGNFNTYDKRHLFRMAKEDEHYTAGNQKLITSLKGWNICPLICYDLRFPVWSRNRFQKAQSDQEKQTGKWDYDLLIYVANWPEVRNHVWKNLLVARAIENQCYVIGVNRIGKDGHDFNHSGDSAIINPRGEILSKIKAHEEGVETIFLDQVYLHDFIRQFPVGMDADNFDLK